MTEQSRIVRILDRGYSIIWREGRLEDGLRGLDEDFEWEAPPTTWTKACGAGRTP